MKENWKVESANRQAENLFVIREKFLEGIVAKAALDILRSTEPDKAIEDAEENFRVFSGFLEESCSNILTTATEIYNADSKTYGESEEYWEHYNKVHNNIQDVREKLRNEYSKTAAEIGKIIRKETGQEKNKIPPALVK